MFWYHTGHQHSKLIVAIELDRPEHERTVYCNNITRMIALRPNIHKIEMFSQIKMT